MKQATILILLLALITTLEAQQKESFGIVFNDCNNNQIFDKGDIPLKGIAVSTLDTITKTSGDGTFSLPVTDRDIVFVIKPSDYNCVLSANNIPKFYYLHFPAGSPDNLEFKGIEPTGNVPDTLLFPLYKSSLKQDYKAHLIGDIQAPTIREIRFFRESIVPELLKYPVDFSICLGDIADNNLSTYPEVEQSLAPLGNPIYMVFGNHDINYQSPSFEYEAETFRRNFGPDYYSFNYGKTHFIVLNSVLYKGWNESDTSNGSYTGSLYPRELKWLKQDLKLARDVSQIVVFAHIPILINTFEESNLKEVLALLDQSKKPLMGIFGHMHQNIAWDYNEKLLWKGKQPFKGLVAGATCGAWYGGPYNLDSIPEALCTDGSPRGFYNLFFNDKSIAHEFIPFGKPKDYQMRISFPGSIVSIDSLSNSFIYLNIFDSDRNCTVNYTIDKTIKGVMANTVEFDPYVVRNIQMLKNYDDWYPGPSLCSHLWKAPFPINLEAGVHLLEIEVKNNQGKIMQVKKIFEIVR